MLKYILCLLFSLFSVYAQSETEGMSLGALPIQDAGRIKPFDTFARESLALVWGRETYKKPGKSGSGEATKLPATDVVFSWLVVPEVWSGSEIILIRNSGLREALKLENERLYYSPNELLANERLPLLLQDLRTRQDAKEKLNPFYQAVQTLERQVATIQAVGAGLAFRILPDKDSTTWRSVSQFPPDYQEAFAEIIKGYSTLATTKGKDTQAMDIAVANFVSKVKSEFGDQYAPFNQVKAELHYNKFHPFMYSWIFYLLSALCFTVILFGGQKKWQWPAWIFLGLAFLLHTYGFGLRVFISGRAPVTNMYETVVWVAWGAVIVSVILDRVFKLKILLLGATIVATLSLILCDLSSHVLDGSIHPLEPVLRDNFWLLTHVLTITLSYATFFVAFIIGDIVLYLSLRDEAKNKNIIASSSQAIYRLIQVGVALLAAGTILGGVWADYSWGRFWGWDPKETWAFIALMGYLAILHGRLVGWLRNYGLAAASILAFSLVIMAWYGVNFVLGAGLHTYGFGAGGVEYVSGFVAVHILYVAFVTTVRHTRKAS